MADAANQGAMPDSLESFVSSNYFIEVAGVPVPTTDMEKWADSMNIENRAIARTQRFGFDVSSVFLGMNTNIFGERPVCYETMIFGYFLHSAMWRSESRQGILEHHKAALSLIDSMVSDAIKAGSWRRLKAAGIAHSIYDPDEQRAIRKWFAKERHKAKATLRAEYIESKKQ